MYSIYKNEMPFLQACVIQRSRVLLYRVSLISHLHPFGGTYECKLGHTIVDQMYRDLIKLIKLCNLSYGLIQYIFEKGGVFRFYSFTIVLQTSSNI